SDADDCSPAVVSHRKHLRVAWWVLHNDCIPMDPTGCDRHSGLLRLRHESLLCVKPISWRTECINNAVTQTSSPFEGFTPHITLDAGVKPSGPALSSRPVFSRDEIARCGSHANVIRRSRLSPDIAGRGLIAHAIAPLVQSQSKQNASARPMRIGRI